MDNVKNDAYYIEKIFDDLAFIVRHMTDMDQEAFSGNEVLQDSMMFRLVQISEKAKKLSEEYKEQHSAVPWAAIYGLRNRIVHDYGSVNCGIIYQTLKKDIPVLMESMKRELKR